MLVFKKVDDLTHHLKNQKEKGLRIGFVPTMGALHEGHLSLVRASLKNPDFTVCSIFVNPTQFNESVDLENYPRTPQEDIPMLIEAGCNALFLPPVSEIYPNGYTPQHSFDFGKLDKPMEGANRPGHFQGMAQVVNRLLEIINPDSLFMGQKDYQQFAIVYEMLSQMKSQTELIMCPIVREADGLAMSSRNRRLDIQQRSIAPNIHRVLKYVKDNISEKPISTLKEEAMKMLEIPGMMPEYFEIVDGVTLEALEDSTASNNIVACTAVRVGEIRLIDNIILKP